MDKAIDGMKRKKNGQKKEQGGSLGFGRRDYRNEDNPGNLKVRE